jgi:hypothetical protein
LFNSSKDASAARLRQGGRTTAFLAFRFARFWRVMTGLWQAGVAIRMEHFEGD